MAGPVLYSTNCWIAHTIAQKYRNDTHYVWCSEHYDPASTSAGSVAAAIAPSSSPKTIYDTLKGDCHREDEHSSLIKGYKKTFRRLATAWRSDGSIEKDQYDEIIATIGARTWRGWRPLLFVIPVEPVKTRIIQVPRQKRAGFGTELQILDLKSHEFDVIEL